LKRRRQTTLRTDREPRVRRGLVCLLVLLAALAAAPAAPAAPAVAFAWVAEDRDVDLLAFRSELCLEQGRYADARKWFNALLRRSRLLQNRASAALGLGYCLQAHEDYPAAAEQLMSAVDAYAHYLPFATAVQAEFDIAVNHLDGKRYFLGLFSRTSKAALVYDHVQRVAPYLPVGPLALYRRSLISDGDADEEPASNHPIGRFEAFLARYPAHELAPEVRLKLIAELLARAETGHGDLLLRGRARHELDQLKTLTPDARREAETVRLARQADDIEARKLLELAEFYLLPVQHRPAVARRYLEELLQRHGDSPAAARGRLLLAALRGVKSDQEGTPTPLAPETTP
jgi:tetratricopeptide (TPR) repeat protein